MQVRASTSAGFGLHLVRLTRLPTEQSDGTRSVIYPSTYGSSKGPQGGTACPPAHRRAAAAAIGGTVSCLRRPSRSNGRMARTFDALLDISNFPATTPAADLVR